MTRPLWNAYARVGLLDRPWILHRTDPGDPDRVYLTCRRCRWNAEFLSSYQAKLAHDQHTCPPPTGGDA